MSRAYRIRVRESLTRVIRASDHVSTQLELLDLLPPEEMAELLGEELEKQGFRREGETAVREEGEVTITVDLPTGTVTVRAETAQQVEVEGEKRGTGYDDVGPSRKEAEKKLREQLQQDLEKDVSQETDKLQQQLTDDLERQLGDIRAELDRAANRATAAALKVKAAQMGQIKEMTEDPEGGLTIVVEV